LIPLTIKQLLTASHDDDVFKVDGADLFTVKLIGTIDGLEEHSTNFTFKLSDGTGVIECKQWIEKDAGPQSKISKLK
jgi:replication factor A2